MIGVMRRYRLLLQIGLLVVVAAFIASLFVFGTKGFGDGESGDAVVTVNGEPISFERYQRRYQDYLEALSAQSRERLSPALAEQLGLPQQLLNSLVQEALVVQRARAEGLEVSDEELSAQIQAARAFQEGGRFSMRRYQEFLRRRGMTASAFETLFRPWNIEGQSVRPFHRMVAHTGFITVARRVVPEEGAPAPRLRRAEDEE